jgi:hypothetical protein
MSKQKRPSVDTHAWDAAETLLELMPKFNALREDIRTELKWELAGQIQRVWEVEVDG